MNIHLHNVNLNSSSGPDWFAQKLIKYGNKNKLTFNVEEKASAHLCFIESQRKEFDAPMFQRLDGIYFNTRGDYNLQNDNIKRTYEMAKGVIFQSDFNRQLITKYFGEHDNSVVIHNGADLESIQSIKPINNSVLDRYENVWCCAARWRPHKRLKDNIRYFLEHAGEKDCLVVAGKTDYREENDRIYFAGTLPSNVLLALYKRCKYFLHLTWLDHCPNVVVDARAANCKIICSSTGGTKEIAGTNAIIIQEDEWDFEPIDLYNPPVMDFDKKTKNSYNIDYNMNNVAYRYRNFLEDNVK